MTIETNEVIADEGTVLRKKKETTHQSKLRFGRTWTVFLSTLETVQNKISERINPKI